MKNKKDILHFISAAYVNGYFWASALEWNGYYRLNISTGQAEFLGLFSYANFWDDKLFNQILAYQKYVFYIPWFSNFLVRLDTETLDTKYWMLPENIVSETAKFRVAKIYEKKIVMFPHVGKDICIFDIENETFKCDRKWIEDLSENKEKDYFISGFQKENMLYLAHVSGNFMMKYDLKNYQQVIILFPEHEKGIVDIVQCSKKELLVLTGVGNVWRYDLESKEKECIYVYNGKVEYPYVHIIPLAKCLYLIPANENNIKKISDAEKKELSYPIGWKIQNIDVGLKCTFWGVYREKDKIMLYPCIGNMLLQINDKQEGLSGIVIYDDKKEREREILKKVEAYGKLFPILPEVKIGLDFFLNFIREKKCFKNSKNINVEGKRIWNIFK